MTTADQFALNKYIGKYLFLTYVINLSADNLNAHQSSLRKHHKTGKNIKASSIKMRAAKSGA